ncbi:hypothetical protein SY27_17745 [Flavobacterium sp. 316]|uniref:hypothetical protein n=1 Tax=Flavobacterium sp. 316 TaxID=1603293 RepID=UPI0005E45077|nr:hypothetical protein [Flavobacterium sp. 316]KIX19655.1 hypothetical protein SY27_17745 [Flavobacterium sp. 316]
MRNVNKIKCLFFTCLIIFIFNNCKKINEENKEDTILINKKINEENKEDAILINKKKVIDTIEKEIIKRDSILKKMLDDINIDSLRSSPAELSVH